jgi:hypothetical protein
VRLDLHLDADGCGLVVVSLSQRNLAALQAHLVQRARANPMLIGGYVYRDGVLVDGVALAVLAEPDRVHYNRADRVEPPGPMQPATEAAIRWAEAREEQGEDGELQ